MKKLLVLLPLLLLFLTGCLISVKTDQAADGGVYKSPDQGDTWTAISSIYRVGETTRSFASNDVISIAVDPTDRQAIYVGTEAGNLFYTYNGGEAWSQSLSQVGKINALAVDPVDRCVIYAAIDNRVYKSVDCSRHWDYQLIETRADLNHQITALAIDPYNPAIIYAGTSGNGLFVSSDRAYSWRVNRFFEDRISKILINPKNSKIIYVATVGKGIFKSIDQGQTWRAIFEGKLEEGRGGALSYRELIMDPTVDDGLFYASSYGLLRSLNGGETWQELKLLTPHKTTVIYSLAINPKNGQEIYYGTAEALYRSHDNGLNWVTRKLPSQRAAKHLLIDPQNPKILYLGVKKVN